MRASALHEKSAKVLCVIISDAVIVDGEFCQTLCDLHSYCGEGMCSHSSVNWVVDVVPSHNPIVLRNVLVFRILRY